MDRNETLLDGLERGASKILKLGPVIVLLPRSETDG